jgi:hypothetical protein
MDFDYKPGFKVGMGGYFDHDNWDMHAEYTWFHNSQSTSEEAPSDITLGQILPMWGFPDSMLTEYSSVSSDWDLKMDIAELDLGRSYYVGTKLTFRPNFGVRAAWIRQTADLEYAASAEFEAGPEVTDISEKSSSWAVGAKTGLDTNWYIGSGFRVFGCGEADLLFTRYTTLSFSEEHTDVTSNVNVKQKSLNTVKPHLDLELGFGWGTDLDCHKWYMDFALGYGFQVFFDQNMFRHFNDDAMIMNSTSPNGNLYVQGLTATFKLDF